MKPLFKWLIALPLLQKLIKIFKQIFRPFHSFYASINSRWQQLSPFRKNFIFGLFIALLLFGLRHGQWISEMDDLSADWMMTLYRGDLVKENTPPFVILDIDDDTYKAWGEPLFTPRDKLLTLLKFAIQGQPKLIIVDIAISQLSHQGKGLHPHDQALQEYLNQYESKYCQQSDCPTILLARTFRLPKGIKPFEPDTEPYYLEQRRTFLDKTVLFAPHIDWAAMQFEREHDRLLRRWNLWTTTCTQGIPDIVPSIPLLAVALLTEDEPNMFSCACRLHHHLSYFIPSNCNQAPKTWTREELRQKPTEFLVSKDLVFDLHPTRLNRRIIYTIPWYLQTGETLPSVSNGQRLLTIMSANKIIDKRVSAELLHDSIAVIGGSYLEGRDWHMTPLGWMPGMLVLINGIHSLLQYGILQPPSAWWIIFFTIVLIFATSCLLVKYGNLKGAVYSALLVIISILLSFMLFRYGTWLSFVIPWAAIQIRHWLTQ